MGGAAAVDHRAVGRRALVRVHRLQRVYEDTGDILARGQHVERAVGQFGQGQRVVGGRRVADAGLHIAPPAMIGPGKAHHAAAAGMIARQAHRLHHRFGARHVERDLVHAADAAQPRDIGGDDRMVGAKHRTQFGDARAAFGDAVLVEVVAEQVDAIGAGKVVEDIAVEIRDGHARRRLVEGTRRQRLADLRAELERHAVAAGELQVGEALAQFLRRGDGVHEAGGVERGQAVEAGAALLRDRCRGIVGGKEARVVIVVKGDLARDALAPADMAGERAVLGATEPEAGAALGGGETGDPGGDCESERHHG